MAKISHNSEMIVDDNGIEILVGYDYEKSGPQIEECHGYHDVGNLVSVKLTSVEVIICGTGIDILPQMTKKQIERIEQILNID